MDFRERKIRIHSTKDTPFYGERQDPGLEYYRKMEPFLDQVTDPSGKGHYPFSHRQVRDVIKSIQHFGLELKPAWREYLKKTAPQPLVQFPWDRRPPISGTPPEQDHRGEPVAEPSQSWKGESDTVYRTPLDKETMVYRSPDEGEEESAAVSVLKWIRGTLQGEWNDNPTTAQVVVDTIITLIPYADQAGDVRDISAYLYKFLYEKRYDEVLLWVGFVFTLIGVVPGAGSAAKGASRVLIKLLKEDSDEAFELLAKLGKNELKHLDTVIRKMDASRLLLKESAGKVLDRADGAIVKLREGIQEAQKLPDWADMGGKLKQLDSMLVKMQDTLQEVREIAPEKIDEGITYLGRRWGPIAARLGIRGELSGSSWLKEGYRISQGPSGDPGLDAFIATIEKRGIKVLASNINIFPENSERKPLREIDVVTDKALIQFKNGSFSTQQVIEQLKTKTLPFVTRPVIAYINQSHKGATRTINNVRSHRYLITNDINELIIMIENLR